MLKTGFCVALALPLSAFASQIILDQQTIPTPQAQLDDHDSAYEFHWPIEKVAIIGAGVSGLLAYKSLLETNHFTTIRIFERDSVPGGNWHYTSDTPSPVLVSQGQTDDWWKADYIPEHHNPETVQYTINTTNRDILKKKEIDFVLPKPIWETLKSNTPAPQQQITEFPWPPHVPWASHWSRVQKYLRAYAAWLGVGRGDQGDVVEYNTRVEYVEKRWVGGDHGEKKKHEGWKVGLHRFERVSEDTYQESWWEEEFDAVIVASGRFNIPHVPPIPGLEEWQRSFPDQVYHSREYRNTSGLEGKSVIVVGASASATGISADINTVANTSYLSIRDHSDDPRSPVRRAVHLSSVPPNTTVLPEIRALHPTTNISEGIVELVNGTNLTGVDAIIFGTGFRYSFPYLSQYHNTSANRELEEHPIVTDGSHLQALWYDTFYIDQPTIAFQGQLVGIQSFVYGRYTGTAIAKVWSGQASLPNTASLWRQFHKTVQDRGGLRRGYQWLTAEKTRANLLFFTNWLNREALEKGGEVLDLPPDVSEEMALWQRARGAPVEPDARNDFWKTSGPEPFGEDWTRAVMDDW